MGVQTEKVGTINPLSSSDQSRETHERGPFSRCIGQFKETIFSFSPLV